MWLFLATEVLFFGGLILCWIFSRHGTKPGFDAGARETTLWIGTLNTAHSGHQQLCLRIGLVHPRRQYARDDPVLEGGGVWPGFFRAEIRAGVAG